MSLLPAWRVVLVALAVQSCGSPQREPPPPPLAAPPPEAQAEPATKVGVMEGSVVFVDCPDKLDVKEAERTINRLVEPCESVPGGTARFRATLAPRGRIEIAAADGSSEGVIPICVLKNRLTHKIRVNKPCQLDVQIEERKISGR
jgi:hypothetical protein